MLYIMRHGKTEWNALHKLQGRTDIPLNDEGKRMARQACEKYKELNIDVCYCSPLVRAVETAQIVLKNRKIPIIEDKRLSEMSFGKYEGIENSLAIPDCPINVIFNQPEKYIESVGGAETFEQLFARTGSFLKEVVEPQIQAGKDILIVGHGAMNSAIICQVKKLPIEEFWSAGIEQCKIIKLI
ncbi:MAG: histidine phosphatase family protein [Roseburia sp.]|uniref:histidine phosphatase family protein n=1 Tax=Roseburia sp. 831b TaxID=1261635 RepID=UPI0009530B63|nr:histidine phosphatase family protein [Roseburia sp. 831b]MCI5917932.1 histidine phosphatase family protein [Roseburia sp.]MDD6217406.1 histidine phosphatase family protein [Roseburia sp.]MDY5882774.1 histidine phosphatase family protein [Roseburia sp.]WVK72620.1 histidine phosphatase family protein [Roseburia sp. 831b]